LTILPPLSVVFVITSDCIQKKVVFGEEKKSHKIFLFARQLLEAIDIITAALA
jgi:hypothetical protein